jgi:hypothetical protein
MLRLLAVSALALVLVPSASAPAQGAKTKTVTITVAKAEPKLNVVNVFIGKAVGQQTMRFDNNSVLTIDGKPATLADVKAGYTGSVTYNVTNMVVVQMDLESGAAPVPGKEVLLRGTVEAVAAGQLTVNRTGDGKEFTLKLTKNTKILVDGVSAGLNGVKRGLKVDVFLAENTDFAVRVLVYVKDTPPELK